MLGVDTWARIGLLTITISPFSARFDTAYNLYAASDDDFQHDIQYLFKSLLNPEYGWVDSWIEHSEYAADLLLSRLA